MSKNISLNLSSFIDLSNHSTADIIAQTRQAYRCNICKDSNSKEELVEFCKCDNPVHQRCMAHIIEDWIDLRISQNDSLAQDQVDQKIYICLECHGKIYYRSKTKLICRNFSQMWIFMQKNLLSSILQFFFFFLGLSFLIFGILVKAEKVLTDSSINKLTLSIIAVAIIIASSVMILSSFYFIFVDIFTDGRKRVHKIYQRNKKDERKPSESIPVVRLS